MSYCLNPACPSPQNLTHTELCQACGYKLLLRDRYRIIQALGQGGFGATFLAANESLPGKPSCVIKQLRPNATAPHVMEMARELFAREAATLGRIGNHPQIPSLLDYFEEDAIFYLVQEYVSGLTLQQEIKGSGPRSENQVKMFLSEILPILEYVHGSKVIHRDIKPANMIRRNQDQKLVLIDFGAVKNQNTQQTSTSDQTALTSYAIGTPGFAPPEQMAMRPVPASDIYALGVTCIYLLTGKSPKDLDYDPSTGELLWQKYVSISEHFQAVLSKMLEISVKQRYRTAPEVFRALDLEDHLEMLENSMTSIKPGANTGRKNSDHRGIDSTGTKVSPHARMAMAIRTRQQPRYDSTNLQSGFTRGRLADSDRLNSGIASRGKSSAGKGRDNSNGKKVPLRLDAEGLQNYYSKGKRDFASHDLRSLSLAKANLEGANFHQANLSKINLQGANLFNADFGKATVHQACLRDANLGKAYMSNADLEGADLRGADLSGAYLLNANLRGANLCGTNLSGAKVTEEQLAMARTNWMTIRPNGKRGIW
ncbi:pentapeptide repeat-containing protein [Phormidium sp. CLA17]|uniref:serine/threonine-protein kinase n=1 Tax=Leptolyngbya sp. Cla-17 TaxID=2803751 RepID=UPI001491EA0D|nr:serine/threonine-protein kinase [Leptolyngbya sp. Cla-17]MBM0741697.1 pentapeptide repeat-containing protein [Leptolyngbya sp. Cla-17]